MLEKFRSSGVNTGRIKVNETLKQAEFYQKRQNIDSFQWSLDRPRIKASQFTASRFHTTRI